MIGYFWKIKKVHNPRNFEISRIELKMFSWVPVSSINSSKKSDFKLCLQKIIMSYFFNWWLSVITIEWVVHSNNIVSIKKIKDVSKWLANSCISGLLLSGINLKQYQPKGFNSKNNKFVPDTFNKIMIVNRVCCTTLSFIISYFAVCMVAF